MGVCLIVLQYANDAPVVLYSLNVNIYFIFVLCWIYFAMLTTASSQHSPRLCYHVPRYPRSYRNNIWVGSLTVHSFIIIHNKDKLSLMKVSAFEPLQSCMPVFKLRVNRKALGFKAGLTLQLSILQKLRAKCCHNWINHLFKYKMDYVWHKHTRREMQKILYHTCHCRL